MLKTSFYETDMMKALLPLLLSLIHIYTITQCACIYSIKPTLTTFNFLLLLLTVL